MKWSENDERDLLTNLNQGLNFSEITIKLKRTKRSIKEKSKKIRFSHKSIKKSIKCLNCSKEIEISIYNKRDKLRKFCSSSCSASYNNKKRTNVIFQKISKTLKDGVIKDFNKCIICGKETKNHIYCSNKCHNEDYYCGWGEKNEYTGKIPLEVEHIDGNSENNKEENLTLLCPNCHSLTKTYKGANKGNGRFNRRERYKENKSY